MVVIDDSNEELNPSGLSHSYSLLGEICTNIHPISACKCHGNAPAVPGAESSEDKVVTGAKQLENKLCNCDQFFEPPSRILGKTEPICACIKCL